MIVLYVFGVLLCLIIGIFAGYGVAIFLYQHNTAFRRWIHNWADSKKKDDWDVYVDDI